MKTNLFYQNRKEIEQIAFEQKVDADIATDIFINKNGIDKDTKDYTEWKAEIVKYQRHKTKTLSDLFE